MNNADYGLSLQKLICEVYNIEVNSWAEAQFESNFNKNYEKELYSIIPYIFDKVKSKPKLLLTYTQDIVNGRQVLSPHNFILEDGRTLSIRTFKSSDKVAPKTIGQAGFSVLNDFFSDTFGGKIETKEDVRNLIFNNIHDILPIFIDNLFQSDVTVFLFKGDKSKIQIINAKEVSDYSFSRNEFTFTRDLDNWVESTTLKYNGKSIAEIQTHKERSFKFRFIVSSFPEWFKVIKENTESFGISAEGAICDYFHIVKPVSFERRVVPLYVQKLRSVIEEIFIHLPKVIYHTGSLSGNRGDQSKCSYDFILDGNKTLSLKTNKGKMVCPPEVGQPGSKTCLLYFGQFFEENIDVVTSEKFKIMVLSNIEKIIPIYVEYLFDSDWLLWIYEERETYKYKIISKKEIKDFIWDKKDFSFTKSILSEWNESNTVKYCGKSLGEFQVHQNRNCFKFRFNMKNLLEIIIDS